tara:strand:+ start:197 stop:361 length:165 start_codon:yes stop_codon:yes gene_type:complete
LSFSSKNINENTELKIGENESRGIVKLSSEELIASKKRIAEITPIMIRIKPGKK